MGASAPLVRRDAVGHIDARHLCHHPPEKLQVGDGANHVAKLRLALGVRDSSPAAALGILVRKTVALKRAQTFQFYVAFVRFSGTYDLPKKGAL